MKFLHVIPTVDPRGGGPMEGLRHMGQQLQQWGHQVEVACADDPAAPWVANHPLTVHALGPGHARYGYAPRLLPWLREHAAGYDLVVVNGLWQYHGLATHRALRASGQPYVVFTHGMLDPWFKHTYPLKHLKKWLYWPWAEYRLLRDAAYVLFTSEDERLLARESFWLYRANERVTAYGTSLPPPRHPELAEGFLRQFPALRGQRVLLFLSRIQEKKGCDLLIEAFAAVASHDERLQLVMAGPDQSGWVAALQAQAQRLGVAHRVHWTGMLQGDLKWGAFQAAEAFVLPSHQENFGIAVAEALGCGLPVLISNKINIWREIEQAGAGFVATDTVAGTQSTLLRWLALDGPARAAMGQHALRLFDERYTVRAMAQSLLDVAHDVAASTGGPHPRTAEARP